MKKIFTLLLVLCSFSLVGCGGSDGPGDRVEALAYAMEAGDTETVVDIAPGMLALMGKEKLDGNIKEGAAKIKGEGGIKSVTIDKEEIDGETATVTATVVKGNGDKETEDFNLSKVDGKWIVTLGDDGKSPGENEVDAPNFDLDIAPE